MVCLRPLRLLLDRMRRLLGALLLLLLLPWLHVLLRRLLGALWLLLLLHRMRRLLLHTLLLRLRGVLRLLRPLGTLLLDLRLWLLRPLRLLLLHSLLLGCRLWCTLRLLRTFGMLLLRRLRMLLRWRSWPPALLLSLFVFLVLGIHWYDRSQTQEDCGGTRYSKKSHVNRSY